MQRDQPLLGGQPKSDSSKSPSMFGFRQHGHVQSSRDSHIRGDLEMNLKEDTTRSSEIEPRNSAISTISQFFDSGNNKPANKNPALKDRKVPTKIEPKVFFSNERTFLSWLNMAVTLSTISLAVIAFADTNKMSQIYGVMLLPVAISFIVYALFTYMRRAVMIRNKDPGPYEDRRGPIILACMLAVSIIINFIVKVVEVM